eukprot:TRINITY_DN1101_c0_g1_i1.p1 TRINITY_DN1101_c0_g1~~TRINITY_DN1101_c0_g1_i1.p1  ORF type:complete len:339 (+),score=86.15 TRINITY_DN1101_c0_g1_i1:112-1128(+)
MKELKGFTHNEVAAHNTAADGWLIIDNWVVDVSDFYDIHPGGMPVLLEWLGKDATAIFRDSSSHVHSGAATDLISKFRVGFVEGTKTPAQISKATSQGLTAADFNVDMSKGLLWQSANLGDQYQPFINSILVLDADSLRYFDSDFLEFFSRSSWKMVPIVWFPVSFLFFTLAVNSYGLDMKMIPFYLVAGILSWSLTEYTLHKYLFHMKTNTFFMNFIHFMLHGYHHIAPMDRGRLTFPPVPAAILGSFIFSFVTFVLPIAHALGLMAGTIIGYIGYDLIHYYLHHAPPKQLYMKQLKTHHLYHHYKNHDSNFGISSSLFDFVFSTFDSQLSKASKVQ